MATIIVTEPGIISDAVIRAWLAAALPVAAIWTGAKDQDMRVFKPFRRRGVDVERITNLKRNVPTIPETADTPLTIMTPHIVPKPLLARFGPRALNLHPALLPAMRGLSPRHAMLCEQSADRYGGLTIHLLEKTIDTGDIVAREPVPPRDRETWCQWEGRLALKAAGMFVGDAAAYLAGRRAAVPQSAEGAFYRRARRDEFAVTSDKTVKEVRELLSALREALVVCRPDGGFPGRPRTFVVAFDRVLGRPTQDAAILRPGSVELDLRDGRVRLRRPGLAHKYKQWATRQTVRRQAMAIGRAARVEWTGQP